ncbi:MAG: TIGR00725 family protein [Actinomycetota bacterium]
MGLYVAVIGTSLDDPQTRRAAHEIGVRLAQAGATVVCGGLGGVMEAVCQGARSAKGATVGILPGSSTKEANAYVDVAVATGMGEARNAVIVRTADAVIAVGGGYGTLSEIGLALRMDKPVVGYRTWEIAKEGTAVDIRRASSPEEAVSLTLTLLGFTSGDERSCRDFY